MTLPTSYNETTLAAYMVSSLGSLVTVLGLNAASMAEAVNDVTQACGAVDIADVTDVAKVRALAKVAALRVAQTAAAGWYDFGADGGDYKRSQVVESIASLLMDAASQAMIFDQNYSVEVGSMRYVDDPYVWVADDADAEGVA